MENDPEITRKLIIHESHDMQTISDIPSACVRCTACACHMQEKLAAPCPGKIIPE